MSNTTNERTWGTTMARQQQQNSGAELEKSLETPWRRNWCQRRWRCKPNTERFSSTNPSRAEEVVRKGHLQRGSDVRRCLHPSFRHDLSHPSTSRLADRYGYISFHVIGSIFPRAERLGVKLGTCWRVVFFNKKLILGVDFENFWRCSNSSAILYLSSLLFLSRISLYAIYYLCKPHVTKKYVKLI